MPHAALLFLAESGHLDPAAPKTLALIALVVVLTLVFLAAAVALAFMKIMGKLTLIVLTVAALAVTVYLVKEKTDAVDRVHALLERLP